MVARFVEKEGEDQPGPGVGKAQTWDLKLTMWRHVFVGQKWWFHDDVLIFLPAGCFDDPRNDEHISIHFHLPPIFFFFFAFFPIRQESRLTVFHAWDCHDHRFFVLPTPRPTIQKEHQLGEEACMAPGFVWLAVLCQLCARQHDNLCASVGMLNAGCQMEYWLAWVCLEFFQVKQNRNVAGNSELL